MTDQSKPARAQVSLWSLLMLTAIVAVAIALPQWLEEPLGLELHGVYTGLMVALVGGGAGLVVARRVCSARPRFSGLWSAGCAGAVAIMIGFCFVVPGAAHDFHYAMAIALEGGTVSAYAARLLGF